MSIGSGSSWLSGLPSVRSAAWAMACASAGEFIVAVVDGDFTLKELGYEGEQPILIPHNDRYARIRPQHDLEIFGIVRGIVRKVDKGWAGVRRATFGGSK